MGSVPAQIGLDERVGSRTRGSSETVLGEQRVEERSSTVGIARPVLQSEAVQEKSRARKGGRALCSAWTPITFTLEGALEGSIAAAERG